MQKAASASANDPDIMMLLSYAEYMNRHFDAAISNALQAHSSGRDHSSFVHYIAARAYQQQNQQQLALAEFQNFLKEEPKGPRADQVRADMIKIQNGRTGQRAITRFSFRKDGSLHDPLAAVINLHAFLILR